MQITRPTNLAGALDALDADPASTLLAGGTDLMVEVTYGGRRPRSVIALKRIEELTAWEDGFIGSGVTWTRLEHGPLRGMAQAARTVGSPQIRNAGTVGGNLATCSPAGDGLPVLAAYEATVDLIAASGRRSMPIAEFMIGVKRTALRPGELIESVTVPLLDGPQGYSKVGVRNAMVIATASACVATDLPSRSVRIALGSVAPTVIRVPDAELLVQSSVDWTARSLDPELAAAAGAMAAEASRPIDDHRSTAAYRRHAVSVMVRRQLLRAFRGGEA